MFWRVSIDGYELRNVEVAERDVPSLIMTAGTKDGECMFTVKTDNQVLSGAVISSLGTEFESSWFDVEFESSPFYLTVKTCKGSSAWRLAHMLRDEVKEYNVDMLNIPYAFA